MEQKVFPVDVISMCSASGEIRPLRFRMEDEHHQLRDAVGVFAVPAGKNRPWIRRRTITEMP